MLHFCALYLILFLLVWIFLSRTQKQAEILTASPAEPLCPKAFGVVLLLIRLLCISVFTFTLALFVLQQHFVCFVHVLCDFKTVELRPEK